MKSLSIILFALCIHLGAVAQDMIIKTNGDQIECKILKVLNNSVQFTLDGDENQFEILRSEVSQIIKGEEVRKEQERRIKEEEENKKQDQKRKKKEEEEKLKKLTKEREQEERNKNEEILKHKKSKKFKDQLERKKIISEGNGDVIITKDDKIIPVKIISITKDEIVYRSLEQSDGLQMDDSVKIARSDVKEIIKNSSLAGNETGFQKKEEENKVKIQNISDLPEAYRNKVKMSFTGFGNGSIMIGYERALNLRLRTDVILSSHGSGITPNNIGKSGIGLEIGLQFKLTAPVESQNLIDNHYLHGAYIKAAVGGSTINEQIENPNNSLVKFENVNREYVHAGLDLGYQWVLGTRLTLDVFMGLDYVIGNFESTKNRNGVLETTEVRLFEDGDLYGSGNTGVSAGLHIGYLFSIKK